MVVGQWHKEFAWHAVYCYATSPTTRENIFFKPSFQVQKRDTHAHFRLFWDLQARDWLKKKEAAEDPREWGTNCGV